MVRACSLHGQTLVVRDISDELRGGWSHMWGELTTLTGGALYHYYDPCDTPANKERDDSEWSVVKLLAEEGLVRFADPCVVECHDGVYAVCEACLARVAAALTKKKAKAGGGAARKGASAEGHASTQASTAAGVQEGEKGDGEREKEGERGLALDLDLTKFKATGMRFHRGQLSREFTGLDYARRAETCPPCSSTDFGCVPPVHWAFQKHVIDRHP